MLRKMWVKHSPKRERIETQGKNLFFFPLKGEANKVELFNEFELEPAPIIAKF